MEQMYKHQKAPWLIMAWFNGSNKLGDSYLKTEAQPGSET